MTLLPVAVAGWSLACLVHALLGGSPRATHRYYVGFGRTCILLGGTPLERHGLENVSAGQAYVVVSNHESNWDSPTILAGLPTLLIRFVLKNELLRIPIFGHALRHTGNIPVERTRRGGDAKRVQEQMGARDPEVSILFFAEGTRARDGAYRAFKRGAFSTAVEQKLPILPVAIAGTFRFWPTGRPWIHSGPVVLEIGKPISTEGLSPEERRALRERVHRQVGELRSRARSRLRARGVEPGGVD